MSQHFTQSSPRIIVLAAGGTGGHLFPAEALAEVLLARGYQPVLLTDNRFDDYASHEAYDAFSRTPVYRVASARSGGSFSVRIRNALGIVQGVVQALKMLKSLTPVAVIGFGGYPSFPTMLAAVLRCDITLLQEQNSVLGRTNRILAPMVKALALTYPVTRRLPSRVKARAVHIGNPVRAQVKALAEIPYAPPVEGGILKLLVIGGSQGAKIFSEVVPKAVEALPEEVRRRIRIDQQCRRDEVDEVRARYEALGLQADIQPFFNDMSARLASAHLVIARAGASTVSELSVAGRPAILVPLPSAADQHQYYNAQAVEDIGGGVVMPQSGFTAEALSAKLIAYSHLPATLHEASRQIRLLARPRAAEALADLLLKTAGCAPEHPQENTAPQPPMVLREILVKEAV